MFWCRECNLLEGLAPAIRLLSSMCPEEPSVPQLFSWASAVLSMDDAWDNGDWCVVFCCKRCICFVVSCFFVDSEGFLKKISGRWKWFIQHIFPQYFCRRFIPVVETSKSPIRIQNPVLASSLYHGWWEPDLLDVKHPADPAQSFNWSARDLRWCVP